jgi:starvation-inducible DNA-binding protein
MIDIGLPKKERKLLADALCRILSDGYLLYVKTQGFYWNITGEGASSIQTLFQRMADEQIHALHTISKRIRVLGYFVPSTFGDFLHMSGLKEDHHNLHDAHDIIRRLILDNEFAVRQLTEVYELARSLNDPVTYNMIQDRMRIHGENAWQLRIHLE